MNGPEHWRNASLIITDLDACDYGCPHTGCVHEMANFARAQVHATLSLAAAVIAAASLTPADLHEWMKAIDPEYAAEQDAEVTR